MTNFIKIEYFSYFDDIGHTVILKDDLDKKSNPLIRYINPAQITDICRRYDRDSNNELTAYTLIVLSSREAIHTFMTVDEILEKINGKPKK